MSLDDRFAGHIGRLLGPEFPSRIGLAVSGGGDSMAMLALAHGWARVFGVKLHVATIDHGLRPGSAAEAVMVAEECAALGHPHDVLRWHWDGQGNLQDAARRARLDLLSAWRGDIGHILYAHTRDDQAETLLMRLIRGSGVEGLAAMAPMRAISDASGTWTLIRPLLEESRADLRHYVRTLKVPYTNDPTNEDPSYDRVRVRQAMRTLGLDHDALAETADRMRRALGALRARAVEVAGRIVREDQWLGQPTGDLLIDRDGFASLERDTQLRLLAAALQWIASASYRPRAAALEALLERALSGGGGTLHGARLFVERETLRVSREYNAVRDHSVNAGVTALWDRRWHVAARRPEDRDATLRALGPDGLAQIDDLPAGGPPRDALRSLPALFAGERLLAAPVPDTGHVLQARLTPMGGPFVAFLESR